MKMMVFEELVYQEALRRKLTVPPGKLEKAEADFARRFDSPSDSNGICRRSSRAPGRCCAARSGARC